jgi:hypothetical protein
VEDLPSEVTLRVGERRRFRLPGQAQAGYRWRATVQSGADAVDVDTSFDAAEPVDAVPGKPFAADAPHRTLRRVPDIPDARDFLYSAPEAVLMELPTKVDMRRQCPPVYDQGQLGSCTGNAIGAAFQFDLRKQKLDDFVPSRLFIYYNEREIEGTVDSDSGAMIRDGMKSIAKVGVCSEDRWPYDIARVTSGRSTSSRSRPSRSGEQAGRRRRCRTPSRPAPFNNSGDSSQFTPIGTLDGGRRATPGPRVFAARSRRSASLLRRFVSAPGRNRTSARGLGNRCSIH